MTSWIWAIGRMLGLSTAAGVRASLVLLVLGVLSREGWGFHAPSRFAWLESLAAIAVLVVLTILEIAFDKIPPLDRVQDRLTLPWHMAAGAITGATALGHGLLGLGIGLPAGAALALLGMSVKHRWRPRSTPSAMTVPLLSLVEDLGSFTAAVLSATLPPIGYAIFAWMAWFRRRLSRHRLEKYEDLGALKD